MPEASSVKHTQLVSKAVKWLRHEYRCGIILFEQEMNRLLSSLRRVEVRIEPQTITEFLKWKNRMVEYNGGVLPVGLADKEDNSHLIGDRSSGE
jgi:hypothetical protein